MPGKTGGKEMNMENMEILAGRGTERYIKPRMEIIEMENDTIVTNSLPGDQEDPIGGCDDFIDL